MSQDSFSHGFQLYPVVRATVLDSGQALLHHTLKLEALRRYVGT